MVNRTETGKHPRVIYEREKQELEEFCSKLDIPKLKKEVLEKGEISGPFKDLGKKLSVESSLAVSHTHPTIIYWKAKHCLMDEDIVVTARKIDKEKLFVIRRKTTQDVVTRLKD